jgi:predicted secreted protein
MINQKVITVAVVLLLGLPIINNSVIAEGLLEFGSAPPDVAENGAVVPVELKGSLLGKSGEISVYIEKNISPLAFTIEQDKAILKRFLTRVKFDRTSNLIVQSKRGDEVSESHRAVKVTNTGCNLYAKSTVYGKQKIRAIRKGNEVVITGIIGHVSKTGNCRDSRTGRLEEKDYIQQLILKSGNTRLLTVNLTGNISTNPYFNIVLENTFKPGDRFSLSWTDTNGKSESMSTRLK